MKIVQDRNFVKLIKEKDCKNNLNLDYKFNLYILCIK